MKIARAWAVFASSWVWSCSNRIFDIFSESSSLAAVLDRVALVLELHVHTEAVAGRDTIGEQRVRFHRAVRRLAQQAAVHERDVPAGEVGGRHRQSARTKRPAGPGVR